MFVFGILMINSPPPFEGDLMTFNIYKLNFKGSI